MKKMNRRAFSLIEVLMAVLVLGLGLLGLGAVLPVVIRQQVAGNDATLGATTMESAINSLKVATRLNGKWSKYTNLGGVPTTQQAREMELYMAYRGWFVPTIEPASNAAVLFPRGTMGYDVPYAFREQIQVGDRLFPDDAANEGAPQMVWDIAMRRDETQQGANGYQAAIFVRRVDPRATTGLTTSLHRAIADPAAPNRRVPVAVDINGRPTYDGGAGGGTYSVPFTCEVGPVMVGTTLARNRLAISPQGAQPPGRGEDYYIARGNTPMDPNVAFELISQPGQKIVDNLGNVYTVEGPDPDAPRDMRIIRLMNEMPASATFYSGRQPAPTEAPPAAITHVIAVPQIPVAVNVINVK